MIEFETTEAKWTRDSQGIWIAFKCPQNVAERVEEEVREKTFRVEIKGKKAHRSLDANAYLWVLIGKLAEKTDVPKEAVYRHLIKDGKGNYEVFPVRNEAVEKMIEIWESRGLGWVADVLGESKIPNYTNVVLYYGSSVYDTAQMSRLIDSAVYECETLGIPTIEENELENLKNQWRAK